MKFIFAACFLLLTDCSHLTLSRAENSTRGGEEHVYILDSFLFGTLGFTKIPPEHEICKASRLEFIDFKMNTRDVLLSLATLGIYVPHRVTVTCSNSLPASSAK